MSIWKTNTYKYIIDVYMHIDNSIANLVVLLIYFTLSNNGNWNLEIEQQQSRKQSKWDKNSDRLGWDVPIRKPMLRKNIIYAMKGIKRLG